MTEKAPEQVALSELDMELVRRIAKRDGLTEDQAATNLAKAALARRVRKKTGKGPAKVYGKHAGWNFNGKVWWNREEAKWQCEVWQYRVPLEIVSAESLEEIMTEVSDRYGDD